MVHFLLNFCSSVNVLENGRCQLLELGDLPTLEVSLFELVRAENMSKVEILGKFESQSSIVSFYENYS